jgi:hypothetical protein
MDGQNGENVILSKCPVGHFSILRMFLAGALWVYASGQTTRFGSEETEVRILSPIPTGKISAGWLKRSVKPWR